MEKEGAANERLLDSHMQTQLEICRDNVVVVEVEMYEEMVVAHPEEGWGNVEGRRMRLDKLGRGRNLN